MQPTGKYKPKALPKEVATDMRALLFGGGGGHVAEDLVTVLKDVKFPRANFSTWAFNTDREDLFELPSESIERVLIGENVLGGCGAGSNPANGLLAAEENKEDFDAIIAEGEIIIFFACLGGGTGTGTIPLAVELFKQQINGQEAKNLREKRAGIVFVTTPFESEDRIKHQYAKEARDKLYDLRLPLICIPNDKFLSQSSTDRTIQQMRLEGNTRIAQMLGRLSRSLGKRHNLNNIDRNDIISNLLISDNDYPESYCGVGYGSGDNAVEKALEEAANNPLLEVDLRTCKKAIIAIDCEEAKESDQIIIHNFLAKYRLHTDADWRVGLHNGYEPLPFEREKGATAVAMILAVSSEPLGESQEAAEALVLEPVKPLMVLTAGVQAVAAEETPESPPIVKPRTVGTDIDTIVRGATFSVVNPTSDKSEAVSH